jgi:D-alanyl-D-alanine-carboxypeptidase/D-alanyl-D-alanine-endopeptidase
MGAPMVRHIVLSTAGVGCLLACLASAEPAIGQTDLDRLVDGVAASASDCTGLAIGVEQGAARAERFYGDTGNHGRPNADTEFGIGSITKTLTAMLLAYEDQQGQMHLNDPLNRYAPPGMLAPNFNGQPILLLHLADHTSGLPRMVANIRPPLQPEAMWRFTSHYTLQSAPGEKYLYSNLAYGLLARAFVRHLGGSEDQLFARIITKALGMPDTAIDLTSAQHARLSLSYRKDGGPAPETGPGFPAMAGAGGARSTLRDMMRYLDFQLGKVQLPLSSLLPVMYEPRHAAGAPNTSVGLGWEMRNRPDGTKVIHKDGAVTGFRSFIVFAPSIQTGAVVLANKANCPVAKLGTQLMMAMNGLEAGTPEIVPQDDE